MHANRCEMPILEESISTARRLVAGLRNFPGLLAQPLQSDLLRHRSRRPVRRVLRGRSECPGHHLSDLDVGHRSRAARAGRVTEAGYAMFEHQRRRSRRCEKRLLDELRVVSQCLELRSADERL